MVTRRRPLLLVALFVVLARASLAQNIGNVALIEGTVDIGRGTAWTAASIGTAIAVGDQVRTDASGRVRIVFQDGSVLNVGTNTQVGIEQQSTDADKGIWSSRIRLVKGRVRPLVGDYYQRPGSVYEIETPTAVTGVRGTEFIMTYDPVGDVSHVVGMTGTVAVHSVMDRRRRGVMITADQLTVVARGKFPTPPERVPSNLFREYIEDLQFIGTGRSGSAGQALLASRTVPPPDRPGPLLLQLPGEQPLPGQPQGIDPDPSSGALPGQPPAAVQPSGNLGIHF